MTTASASSAPDLILLECLVAGTTHRENLKKHEPKLYVDQALQLVREADSKYDDWAVKVLTTPTEGSLWLGYLPEVRNETVARLLDAGYTLGARLVHKAWEEDWLHLEIEVLLPGGTRV
ncbi:HIRAN domain-containing protein [Hymenobacter cellulosilyticus]|uniref:HIRAN domain-containing protein n=1 Tax=Hymenobacter cellulosilyticus TaxID=2932248 RepID=A0A8T9Q5J5_9BACT|nr:HIRAN domain-containing protein [Hymenobacter cellulosilyticus]UOQ72365.1 HIRAN domain-containing protein [Hymenobacter cellulosilyticus]